jgi:hypothetical protein
MILRGDQRMFKQKATNEDRINAVEKLYDELLRDLSEGVSGEHKIVDGKNVVDALICYAPNDEGERETSIERWYFKGTSDELDKTETIKEIS